MVDQHAVQEVTRRETSGSALLWFGLLAAPIAWITQLIVNYSLEEWFACSPGTQTEGTILGMGVETVALLVSAILGAVAVAGAAAAFGCYRRAPNSDDPSGRRIRWMGLAGVMNSILYVVVIAVSFGPPLLLDICETSP